MPYTVLTNSEKDAYYSPITYGVACASPTSGVNLQDYLDTYTKEILSNLYPIGSHYITISGEDPNVIFNWGTWEKLSANLTLLGANSTYPLGSTGGEATHKLTIAEMPSHRHGIGRITHSGYTGSDGLADVGRGTASSSYYTSYTGGDGAHNNLQPYIKVIVWKRTA